MSNLFIGFVVATTLSIGLFLDAAAADEGPFEQIGEGLKKAMPKQTLGGIWFWTDVFHNHGWRIQKHCLTGHCRLLDADNARHESGTEDECRETFRQLVPAADRNRPVEKTAIVIHGIGNNSRCMQTQAKRLREAGYTVVPFDYASTLTGIEEAAAELKRLVASLPPTKRIDFVGHSMGGLVIRSLLERCDDDRFGRAVLIGTPNNGAEVARLLGRTVTFRIGAGPAGKQLADGSEFLADLPAPDIEFACIAGGRGTTGYNPLVKGNDDGLVGVDSVRLPGAKDFAVVTGNHHSLLHMRKVVEMTARFLEAGSFDE